MNGFRRALGALLALALVFSLCVPVSAAGTDAAAAVLAASPAPVFGSVGGEWAVIGLARAGARVPDGYFEGYYRRLALTVCDAGGVLSTQKYTEYARAVLALSAIGRDARDVGGFDLTAPLLDFAAVTRQGLNGAVFALLALDSGGYGTQSARQKYVDHIATAALPAGGWALTGSAADADMTAMALCALAPYRAQKSVSAAVDAGLAALSAIQLDTGGFAAYGTETAESTAQVLIALCSLSVSVTDARFVRSGKSASDALSRLAVSGGYAHIAGGKMDQMATEQALLAQAAMARARSGKTALYTMTDVPKASGLSGKDPAVRVPAPSATPAFTDLSGRSCRAAVFCLAARGITTGKTAARFDPDASLTRAEFAALTARALGLGSRTDFPFTDVSKSSRLGGSIGAAYHSGIVNGITGTTFSPTRTVTRQEACAMLARAAKLCGLNPDGADAGALSRYTDSASCASYARTSVAFCVQAGILTPSGGKIFPRQAVTRGEMAEMLYSLLLLANLI